MSLPEPHANIAARFTAAAPTYEQHAEVQTRAADEVMRLLENISLPQRILELGCGTGILTRRLVAAFPDAEFTALD
ncbi:MAG: methyltransferase type 11, partial [Lentisphaerae bacterium]|nr:methyltransferase type 11 [Lentisphaerota bacterium]